MPKIPVIIVDDDPTDRYITRRRLSNSDEIGEVIEAVSGVRFLEEYFNGSDSANAFDQPVLVLMDINMPLMNGFETIMELERRTTAGCGPESVVVVMFTSSADPADRARAEAFWSVKGYILKPLDGDAVTEICRIYRS